MKKKVLSALLCAAMAVSMLAGCGGSKSDSKEADKSATESTKAEVEKLSTEQIAKLIKSLYKGERLDSDDIRKWAKNVCAL